MRDEPQFHAVPDSDLTADQLRQAQAIRAEATCTKPADAAPPSPHPSDERQDR